MEPFCRTCIIIGRLAFFVVLLVTCLVSTSLAQQAVTRNAAATVAVADSGNPYEQNQLGITSALVLGPGRSIADARKWFQKSARQGYAPAQVNLGVLYANGWGTPQNFGAALYWLKAGADQGSARAKT